MNKVTKTIVSLASIALILGLAFYPKLKQAISKNPEEDAKKEKGGPGGKGGRKPLWLYLW